MGSSINLHTQHKRLLRLSTPLGDAALVPQSATGHEVMSQGFEITVDAFSELRHDLQPRDLIGLPVTLALIQEDQSSRYYNGYVGELVTLGRSHAGQRSSYRLVMKPWLDFLDHCTDCRIFQELSVPDVLKQIFHSLGDVARYRFDLQHPHQSYRYLTQYNESDGNFMRRLLELDGIGFIIEHEDGLHTVRFFDDPGLLPDLAPERRLKLQSHTASHDHLTGWSQQARFQSGQFLQRSYDYQQPNKLLQGASKPAQGVLELARAAEMGRYAYTERPVNLPGGHRHAIHRQPDEDGRHQVASGHGNYRHLQPGRHFAVRHLVAGEWGGDDREFTVTQVLFSADDSAGDTAFTVHFEAVPKGEMLLPQGEQPRIVGLQTARVTGPKGEELFTDDLGRVKVAFHWDRDGDKPGEDATCWLRVMQPLAGAGFGAQFTPRIGQEVVVGFENGNPDRPFILGSLYHAEHKPPYAGRNGSRTGLRTRSTKGGAAENCNELYFDDEKGKEEVFLQAERDLNSIIKHNQCHRVGNDLELAVQHDKRQTIGNNEHHAVQKELIITAGERITLRVGGSEIILSNGQIVVKAGVVDVDGGNVLVN